MAKSANDTPNIIEPGCLYTASEAKARLYIGDATWTKLRRRGLRIIRQGRNSYVLSDDILRLFGKPSGESASQPSPQSTEMFDSMELGPHDGPAELLLRIDARGSGHMEAVPCNAIDVLNFHATHSLVTGRLNMWLPCPLAGLSLQEGNERWGRITYGAFVRGSGDVDWAHEQEERLFQMRDFS